MVQIEGIIVFMVGGRLIQYLLSIFPPSTYPWIRLCAVIAVTVVVCCAREVVTGGRLNKISTFPVSDIVYQRDVSVYRYAICLYRRIGI